MSGSAADARRVAESTEHKQLVDAAGPQGSLDHQATHNGTILGGLANILRRNSGKSGGGTD